MCGILIDNGDGDPSVSGCVASRSAMAMEILVDWDVWHPDQQFILVAEESFMCSIFSK